MSDRFRVISHNNKIIYYLDHSNQKGEEYHESIQEFSRSISALNKKDILIIINVTGAVVDRKAMSLLQDATKTFSPIVSRAGILGVGGLKKILLESVAAFSKRTDIKAFTTEEEAKEWLTSS